MPVRICLMCRYHLDSTENMIICGCDDKVSEMAIFKGSIPIKNFIISCPLLVPGKKADLLYQIWFKYKELDCLFLRGNCFYKNLISGGTLQ